MELFKDDISISASEEELAEEEEQCSHFQQREIMDENDIDAPPPKKLKDNDESPSAPNLKEGEMV